MEEHGELNDLVERWFDESFRGSHVARAGADAWNVAQEAKEDLKRRLSAWLAEKSR